MVSAMQRILYAIISFARWVVGYVQTWVRRSTGRVLALDTGRRVRQGRQIAEGGFSYVFEAYDVDEQSKPGANRNNRYVLKRIRCPDAELLASCRKEAGVHRSVGRHPNLMPLLGMTILENDCYMLFPCFPDSLRAEVNRRTGLGQQPQQQHQGVSTRPPWNETTVLQIFLAACRGVAAMHRHNYTHRDIKLENVLLPDTTPRGLLRPVLMDFGSAGPLRESVQTRKDVLRITEEAATHTTMSYRPPELFEGGIRCPPSSSGSSSSGSSPSLTVLDYTKVDVWSLGCTLFAILYGASPSESEFARSDGRLKVVDCSQLKVLGGVPRPPSHSPVAKWYSDDVLQLVGDAVQQDPAKRPTLDALIGRVERLIKDRGGDVEPDVVDGSTSNRGYASGGGGGGDDDIGSDDGIALISTNRLV